MATKLIRLKDGAEQQFRDVIARWPDNVVARNGLANLLRILKRWAEALQTLPLPAHLTGEQQHRDLHMHCLILLGMGGQIATVERLLQDGLKQAPVPQIPYYRRLLMLCGLRAKRHDVLLKQIDPIDEKTPVVDKVVYLHLYAVNKQLDQAKRIATELARSKQHMSAATQKAFQLVQATFCRLDTDCTPDAQALEQLYAAEEDMLLDAA